MLSARSALLFLGALVLLTQDAGAADLENKEWYETTLVYQIWPRAFQDSNGDGEGDLQGIINRLDYFVDLGVETLWLSPIYPSPLIEYDVTNYTDINPLFGNLNDFDELIRQAHIRDLKIVLDVLPNHSSDEHPWFNASVHSVQPYADYYVWHNGTVGTNGTNVAPNNWESAFAQGVEGSAWTWNEVRGAWYLHNFAANQPDLNLRNDVVLQDFLTVFDFWLERGVDGFRIDAVPYFIEDAAFRDNPTNGTINYNFGLEESTEVLYKIRAHIDGWIAANSNQTKLLLVAEGIDSDATLMTYYGNATTDGIAPFNFRFITSITSSSNASYIKDSLDTWMGVLPTNATTNWVLSNQNNRRTASRLGLNRVDGLNMINLLMPGQAYTYYGDEIAMLDHTSITWEQTIDPQACALSQDTYGTVSRDPARTPMQWDATISAGFSTSPTTFLPVNANYLTRNVNAQLALTQSVIQTYKALATLRKKPTFTHGDYELATLNSDAVLVLKRSLGEYPTYVILINVGLSRQTVNLTSLYPELPDTLTISIPSANAVVTGPTTPRESIVLTANSAVVLTDEVEEITTTTQSPVENTTTTESPIASTTPIPTGPSAGNGVIEGDLDWWQTAVIYQIYPKSFQDSNGDGVGDLQGIISRLDHLSDSGVTGLWLSPIYRSPQRDGGYDISNFVDIDPIFGNMTDFDELVTKAHARGIKVIMDFVPNHSSDEHEWFKNSVARIEPYTDYYMWEDGIATNNGTQPPNNWLSVFGGSGWTYNEQRNQYYFHQFDKSQPDLNFRNPLVVDEINNVITFWLDKGVDGFRMDAVSHIFEDPNLTDEPIDPNAGDDVLETDHDHLLHIYTKDQNETYDLVYQWRTLLDDYAAKTDGITRLQATESFSDLDKVFRYYGNATHKGAHLPFNFGFILNLTSSSNAGDYINEISGWINGMPEGSTANWVLGNHDQRRVASRFGLNRADGLNMISLLLPGTSFTYLGEEIAMLDTWISYEDTQDPHAINAGPDRYELFTRDPARTPYQWDNSTSAGFSTNSTTWLPVNSNYLIRNLALQSEAERSVYQTYKSLIQLRQTETIKRGATNFLSLANGAVFAFTRELDGDIYATVVNLGLQNINVDISEFEGLPSGDITVCLASANSITTEGTVVRTTEVRLSANAAVVLCTNPRDYVVNGNDEIIGDLDWWQTAVVYQIYPKSFQDSDGDGVGDLKGITSRLDYLADTGVNGIWLSPIYTSPQRDGGYDISNFIDIDPIFGSLADFDELVREAHARGIKVLMDYVPNHSSDEHEWFKNSVAGIEPYTDYYVWKDGIRTDNGTAPPNNWVSVFSGPAWTFNEQRNQYYLHQFAKEQPDLNFRNPLVVNEMKNVLTFWLERGVDGFRMDAISHIFENSEFPDEPINESAGDNVLETDYGYLDHIYTKDQNETFDMVYQWRALLDEYSANTDGVTRLAALESFGSRDVIIRYYGNETHKGGHLPFNFGLIYLTSTSNAQDFINTISESLIDIPEGRTPNWVLGNHDQSRVASRFGVNRADGLHMISMLLPGAAFSYLGEEIAMLDTFISWEDTQDPSAINVGPDRYQEVSRDPARTPFQWDNSTSAGFSTNSTTWLPVNDNYLIRNVAIQRAADRSAYQTYKSLLAIRQSETFKRGSTRLLSVNEKTVLAFTRELTGHDTYLVVVNIGLARITVDLSLFTDLPTHNISVCLASANSITTTGTIIEDLTAVPLSANAALVLCMRAAEGDTTIATTISSEPTTITVATSPITTVQTTITPATSPITTEQTTLSPAPESNTTPEPDVEDEPSGTSINMPITFFVLILTGWVLLI